MNLKVVEELEESSLELCYELVEAQPPMLRPHVEALNEKELKLVNDESPKLELKQLPSHLRYVFLGERNIYLVIVGV